MPVTYTPPVLIAFANSSAQWCLQAQSAKADSFVTLQQIDYKFGTPLQLWQYGSDQRIYSYASYGTPAVPSLCLEFAPTVGKSQPLVIQTVDHNDQSQLWDWDTLAPRIRNLGASTNPPYWVIDNNNGHLEAGNLVQIYQYSDSSDNQLWQAQLLPTLYFKTVPV